MNTKDYYDKYRSEHHQQNSDYFDPSGKNCVLGANIMSIK